MTTTDTTTVGQNTPPANDAANGATNNASSPVIVCDNLVKIYKVADLEVVALQGLDFIVKPGELMGIVGPSGSGKSSLMNILGGLDRPSAGRVWVAGDDLLKMSDIGLDHYRRSKVGFVWQQGARNLVSYLSAQENVELPMTLAGKAIKNKRRRAAELLDAVGLGDRRHHKLRQMSGGEQQRVAIAVSLANDPQLLLADEPTGELDSNTALSIYQIFQKLNDELGLTIMIVSHDPTIARHVQRVVAIRDGKLATETVRQRQSSTSQFAPKSADADAETDTEDEPEDEFEELIVLDSAGRLQVPKEYLEKLGIRRRVQLEVTEEGILIKPAGQTEDHHIHETDVDDIISMKKTGGLRRLLGRFRRDGNSDERE